MDTPDTLEHEKIRTLILSPSPVSDMRELSGMLRPKPHYLGPGAWYRLVGKINRNKR